MRFIKLIVLTILLVSTSALAVNNENNNANRNILNLAKEVQSLLKKPKFIIEEDISVIVKLTVNRNNEIVILSINSDEKKELVSNYIKSRLNYKKLNRSVSAKVYTLPIKITTLN